MKRLAFLFVLLCPFVIEWSNCVSRSNDRVPKARVAVWEFSWRARFAYFPIISSLIACILRHEKCQAIRRLAFRFQAFGRGWLNRMIKLRVSCATMLEGYRIWLLRIIVFTVYAIRTRRHSRREFLTKAYVSWFDIFLNMTIPFLINFISLV